MQPRSRIPLAAVSSTPASTWPWAAARTFSISAGPRGSPTRSGTIARCGSSAPTAAGPPARPRAGCLPRCISLPCSSRSSISRSLRRLRSHRACCAWRAAAMPTSRAVSRQPDGCGPAASPRGSLNFFGSRCSKRAGESIDLVSVPAARKVAVDAFLAHREAADLFVPVEPLGTLFGQRLVGWLESRGAVVTTGCAVTGIERERLGRRVRRRARCRHAPVRCGDRGGALETGSPARARCRATGGRAAGGIPDHGGAPVVRPRRGRPAPRGARRARVAVGVSR